MKERGIYWLASYPKSGNTWFRAFLQNLLQDAPEPVHINDLHTGQIASARGWIDETLGFDTADLYQHQIDQLRPAVYDWEAQHNQESPYSYHKIHDACWQTTEQDWIISTQATAGVLYIIRNPLDVAISYANHNQCTIDQAINHLNRPRHTLCRYKGKKLTNQVEQRLGSWSEHVASWIDHPQIDTQIIRYEDMLHNSLATFTRAADYLQLTTETDTIAKAIRHANFDTLQAQEQAIPFKERPPQVTRFFRKGVVGDWQKQLSATQIQRIIEHHQPVMRRFHYLDAAGNPSIQ
jgi:hypothetical protein